MSAGRRIFAYWLLLLLAAIGVGAGAWLLLRREESRLEARTASAEAARRAAVQTRASLVAENVELLVGDVEAGLLDTLAEAPAEGLEAFLSDWEKTNPLVRTAFIASPAGRLLYPKISDGDAERGFHRRFAARLRQQPPWREGESEAATQSAEDASRAAYEKAEAESRRSVELNVSQVQRARREVQALAKDRPAYVPRRPAAGAASTRAADSERTKTSNAGTADVVEPAAEAKSSVENAAAAAPVEGRRGWMPGQADGRFYLLGWVWPDGGRTVRGVELELVTLVSRLGGALPGEVSANEGYALRDERGRLQHQAGVVPDRAGVEPAVRVPISPRLLPGWEVAAFVTPAYESSAVSFFWIGTLLAAVLVLAILTSGSLLLWQARRSEVEAAQKTSFVANVSHEFKTPLTTIRLYSELLEQGRVADAAKATEYLRTIGRETQRLARLVNNALDFSRLEQGHKKFQRETCELGAELTRLLDVHEPRLIEAGMMLVRTFPAEPVAVMTDRDAVEQIVLNLLDNACKYAGGGGEVVVTLRARPQGGAELRVADRGPGVPEAERERVFEKFHRVDESLTAEKSGSGLGLSIARQLARGLGGDLRCEARAGGGAEFVFILP